MVPYVTDLLDVFYECIWSLPVLIFIIGLGIYLTILLNFFPIRFLPYACREFFFPSIEETKEKGDISPFQSIMTALAASLGIGNIAGVATALTIGGWGAIFWMWVTAFAGLSIKYAEALLAIRHRTVDANGEMCGGPMVFIEKALGWKSLAILFALAGAIGAFGGGNILQANSVADVLHSSLAIPPIFTGGILFLLVSITLIGGIRSIGRIAAFVVPFMAVVYIGGTFAILFPRLHLIPGIFVTIFSHAFSSQAATGGILGSTLLITIQTGISRGLMTSEAGLGTASIAAAAAKTTDPSKHALLNMGGSFIATICFCTLTALTIGVMDVLPISSATGATLTSRAFEMALPTFGAPIVTLSLVLFAFTTLLGWSYYGERCFEYLFGTRSIPLYRILFALVVIPGATLDLKFVWKLSDLTNGLMAIPNLIAIAALSPTLSWSQGVHRS